MKKCNDISVLNNPFTNGRADAANKQASSIAVNVINAVSEINCQNSCEGRLPNTFRIPTSLERLSAWAVARLMKLTQAVMIKNKPIKNMAHKYFLSAGPLKSGLK